MSYSGNAEAPTLERVSEFVYPTSGSAKQQPADGETGSEIPNNRGNSAHMSENELSRLVTTARAEGFLQGQNQAQKKFDVDLAAQKQIISDALAGFDQERAAYYSKVEIQVVHLALAVAAKILHREAQVDRMVVAGLVKVALERMQQTTKAIIRIRPEDALSWRHYFNTNPDLEIVEDSTLAPNACRIETELGVAEMSLDAQLKEVEAGFFDLLAQRPGAQ